MARYPKGAIRAAMRGDRRAKGKSLGPSIPMFNPSPGGLRRGRGSRGATFMAHDRRAAVRAALNATAKRRKRTKMVPLRASGRRFDIGKKPTHFAMNTGRATGAEDDRRYAISRKPLHSNNGLKARGRFEVAKAFNPSPGGLRRGVGRGFTAGDRMGLDFRKKRNPMGRSPARLGGVRKSNAETTGAGERVARRMAGVSAKVKRGGRAAARRARSEGASPTAVPNYMARRYK